MHKSVEVVKIQEVLDSHNLSHAIAGGYPRSLYFGVEPKDLDIVVACEDSEVVKSLIEGLKSLGVVGVSAFYCEDPEGRLCSVIKVKEGITKKDIDIIFWKGYNTWQDIVRDFDFNVNQFTIDKEGVVVYHGLEAHRGSIHPVKGREIRSARYNRIRQLSSEAQILWAPSATFTLQSLRPRHIPPAPEVKTPKWFPVGKSGY